jgi:hypothetical protein
MKTCLLILLGLPLSLMSSCQYRCIGYCNPVRLASGLVSWWPGNGTARDVVGPNSGDAINGVTFVRGRVGQAFVFDGIQSFVLVPNSASLDLTNDFTIDAWIFPTADAWHATVIGKWGDLNAWASQRSFWLGVKEGGSLVFSLSDDLHQQDGAFHALTSEPGTIPLRTWSHVAAVFNHETGQRRTYVNGIQVAERLDPPFKVHSSIADVTIGAWLRSPDDLDFCFAGRIDEVHIFNRALTESEIRALFRLRRPLQLCSTLIHDLSKIPDTHDMLRKQLKLCGSNLVD